MVVIEIMLDYFFIVSLFYFIPLYLLIFFINNFFLFQDNWNVYYISFVWVVFFFKYIV